MLAKIAALTRAKRLAFLSYRVQTVLSVAALLASVVPIFLIANALQPVMARSIAGEGGQYFAFLVLGLIAAALVSACVSILPSEIGTAIGNGTLEALLATPTRVGTILMGLSGFGLAWTGVRAFLLLAAASLLGAAVQWSRLAPAVLVVLLIVACHLSLGAIASALVIAFRTSAGLPQIVITASMFLGGVYYPTKVIPSWLHDLSAGVPLTYGLRAARRVLLDGAPFASVAGDLGTLALFTLAFALAAGLTVRFALAYGRRHGTLAQY